MKLEIERDTFTEKSTIGKLYIDGAYFCETLEDKDRKLEEGGAKIYAETCIPRGTYELVIDFSPKYQKMMPHILDVPQFKGIRIHQGNTDDDSEGCILVGRTRTIDFIGESKLAFADLFMQLRAVVAGNEKIEITIK